MKIPHSIKEAVGAAKPDPAPEPASPAPADDDRFAALEKRVAKLERDTKKSAGAHAMIRAEDQ